MASAFSFKETTTRTMKIAGVLMDMETMTMELDGEEKKLATLLSPFLGCSVEINVKIKDEQELDEPVEEMIIE